MKDEKIVKNVENEQETEQDVEGYAYCNSTYQKCMTDCIPTPLAGPALSTLL